MASDRAAVLALASQILAGDSRMITRALVADLVTALREAEAEIACVRRQIAPDENHRDPEFWFRHIRQVEEV